MQSFQGFCEKLWKMNKAKPGVFSIPLQGAVLGMLFDFVSGAGSGLRKQELETAQLLCCEDDLRIYSQLHFQSSFTLLEPHTCTLKNKVCRASTHFSQGKCLCHMCTCLLILLKHANTTHDTEFEDSSKLLKHFAQ